jgi:hypothetical protein
MPRPIAYTLTIDWPMLHEQKDYLLGLIDADCRAPAGLTGYGPYARGDHPLDGLVQLIDAIQDAGEASGEKVYSEEDD